MTRRDWRSIGQGRRARWLVGLLVAAIVVGLLAAWLSRGEFKGRYAVPALGADHPDMPARQAAPAVIRPVALPRTTPSAPSPTATEPQPAPAEEDDAPGDADRMARAIDKAARKALRRGEPVRWHKAGESGYVVVSEPRDVGDRTCRNVSATIDGDDGRTQPSSHLWCTSDGDDWEPTE
jgi:hypothetical protein